MNKSKQEKNGEDLHKRYKTLTKKISDQDLRDMLTVLYSEPSLVINNPDFDKLDKKEQDDYAKKSVVLSLVDKDRRNQLLSKLEKDFHIFDEEFIKNPLLEETPEGLKSIIEELTVTFPKASLLIDVIKSTLNLRATGKELSSAEKIALVECFTSEHSDKDYKIVINEDYTHPLKVSRNIKIWDMFMSLVENRHLDKDETTNRLYDYLNFNPNNLITSNTIYPLQRIIEQNDGSYEPLFKTAVHTEKALVQRQNKIKIPT